MSGHLVEYPRSPRFQAAFSLKSYRWMQGRLVFRKISKPHFEYYLTRIDHRIARGLTVKA